MFIAHLYSFSSYEGRVFNINYKVKNWEIFLMSFIYEINVMECLTGTYDIGKMGYPKKKQSYKSAVL